MGRICSRMTSRLSATVLALVLLFQSLVVKVSASRNESVPVDVLRINTLNSTGQKVELDPVRSYNETDDEEIDFIEEPIPFLSHANFTEEEIELFEELFKETRADDGIIDDDEW